MRVVLDANIYLSALISQHGNPFKIIQKWKMGRFSLLISQAIVDEILRVTNYKRIQKKYPKIKEVRLDFVDLIINEAIYVRPNKRLTIVKDDESDNRYFECAVAGSAEYIVSGDSHLLEIGRFQGIWIINPAVFLTLLENQLPDSSL